MLVKMLKQEWRKNSYFYPGRSIAAFPFMVFFFAFSWNWFAMKYSTISVQTLGFSLEALAAFLGIAVASIGFSTKDAFDNVLGDTNYLVYSSHTLPISRKKLYTAYLIKDVLYYFFFVVLPVSLGFLIPTDFMLLESLYRGVFWFFFSVLVTTILTMSSLKLPRPEIFNYLNLKKLSPVADKSVLDLLRSSGGITKILFSVGILTGFYWVLVLKFPIASMFLNNPLLSYSVMIGLVSLSVYNWLNRFDSIDNYSILPLNKKSVLQSKKEAYLTITVPLSILLVLISSLFYSSNIFLSIITAVSMTVYNLAVSVRVMGLNPNEGLFEASLFLEYLIGIGVFAVPLLYLSIIYSGRLLNVFLGLDLIALGIGVYNYSK